MDRESLLYRKIYGCIAAANIGSAMGAAVEWISVPGGGWKAIDDKWGWVEGFMPWIQQERDVRYWNNSPLLHYYRVDMEPGMTEDGAEIRYLLALAIVEKGGRITVDDLAEVWKKHIRREDIGRLVNPHIRIHYDRLTCGDRMSRIPPRFIGAMTPWPGLVDAPHMIGPIGIINAGDPEQAAYDAAEVSLLIQPAESGGTESSKAIAAATAAAFCLDATVESIIEATRANVSENTRGIIDEALELAVKFPDARAIREPMRQHFMPTYPYADGVETAAEAIALFALTRGDVREGMIAATNLGRDTDCIGGMLGPICGAYKGIDGVPIEWVDTVEDAIGRNPYTMQKIPMDELSERLMDALLKHRARMSAQVSLLNALADRR
ncbi:MAG: ADP-ribosylglycohydrolase family protein [Clostridia bacterium]|nr:ADP-ribosylglycohydrolase family protein [Clostridia bacterium]